MNPTDPQHDALCEALRLIYFGARDRWLEAHRDDEPYRVTAALRAELDAARTLLDAVERRVFA